MPKSTAPGRPRCRKANILLGAPRGERKACEMPNPALEHPRASAKSMRNAFAPGRLPGSDPGQAKSTRNAFAPGRLGASEKHPKCTARARASSFLIPVICNSGDELEMRGAEGGEPRMFGLRIRNECSVGSDSLVTIGIAEGTIASQELTGLANIMI